MKTFMAKAPEVKRAWHLIDARDQVLGRIATRVATILQGKHKPIYTPHCDTGDFIVVVNADKMRFTGTKLDARMIRWHSGFIGGLKEVTLRRFMERKPEFVVRLAVRRMLPKTKLARQMLKKLKVYRGEEHPHQAQKPEPLAIK
ncbi:MAG: 50S ribosomal protein L13 [Planctomycetes bacterium]|nr:50S ribosomal protein L13 [Planctomycetota bacterium]